MNIKNYRKRPVWVEAIRLTKRNLTAVATWCNGTGVKTVQPEDAHNREDGISIPTLEGAVLGRIGDWIIKGVAGEFYPCKHDIFIKTYEADDTDTHIIASEKTGRKLVTMKEEDCL